MNIFEFVPATDIKKIISRVLLATGIIAIIVLVLKMIEASPKKERRS